MGCFSTVWRLRLNGREDRLVSVTVANKSGMTKLAATYFIDCTGDADGGGGRLPHRLGRTEDHLCQPMTLNFSIAGVDPDLFEKKSVEYCSPFGGRN